MLDSRVSYYLVIWLMFFLFVVLCLYGYKDERDLVLEGFLDFLSRGVGWFGRYDFLVLFSGVSRVVFFGFGGFLALG